MSPARTPSRRTAPHRAKRRAPGARRSRTPRRPDENATRPGRLSDLALELYRQRTLLAVMATRLREVAAQLERGGPLDRGRVTRALDVHQRYLLEVHHVDEHRVTVAVLRAASRARVQAPSHDDRGRAEAFQRAARARLTQGGRPPAEMTRELAALFRDEADRIDRHAAWDEESLHSHLADWLSRPVQRSLLTAIRRWDTSRVDAEIALVSWASQAHPSAD